MKHALITGADRGLGLSITMELLQKGWRVFAGQFMPQWPELGILLKKYPEQLTILPLNVGDGTSIDSAIATMSQKTDVLDMLVNNAGINSSGEGSLNETLNTERTRLCFTINALGALRMTQACLPMMERGMKRLCYVSSEAGSISVCTREGISGYCMSKTALNMGVHLLFNELQPLGYTFRLYHPGWLRTYMSGQKNTNGKLEADESARTAVEQFISSKSCEDCLELMDWDDAVWPF